MVGNKTDKVRARGPAGPNIGDPPAAAPEYPFGEIPASGVSAHPATTEGRTQAGEIAALEARRRENVLNYCQVCQAASCTPASSPYLNLGGAWEMVLLWSAGMKEDTRGRQWRWAREHWRGTELWRAFILDSYLICPLLSKLGAQEASA